MQKTYWWRITFLFFSGFIIGSGWVYENYFCFSGSENCPLDQFRLELFEPLVILSLSLFAVSIFLFFVNDSIFKKWLRFAIVWFALAVIFITFSPVYSGGYIGLNPTKESVSIWMSSIFVILSLIQIVWESRKLKKS